MRQILAGLGMMGAAGVMSVRMVEIIDEDGHVIRSTLKSFIEYNREGLGDSEVEELIALKAGESVTFGGGAAPFFTVRRVR